MKSKAHSKKCQETGVLEELEAEEGNKLPTCLSLLSISPSPSSACSSSCPPHRPIPFLSVLLFSDPLLCCPSLSSNFPNYWETGVKFTE